MSLLCSRVGDDSRPPPPPGRATGRAALLIAHPGHELRVHHWLEKVRPLVLVLTRGDGHARESRLASTTRVLERAGARIGDVYGRWRDRDVYDALMQRSTSSVTSALDDITRELIAADIDIVVADAEERYNPSHDLCRYLAAAAVERIRASTGRTVLDLEFPLVGPPVSLHRPDDEAAVVLALDEDALTRKLEAASHYPELADEVSHAVSRFGRRAFGVECLTTARISPLVSTDVPYYETYGAAQVAAGRYQEVLTYEFHVRPMRAALDGAVRAPTCAS
jgi:hypothetical protein